MRSLALVLLLTACAQDPRVAQLAEEVDALRAQLAAVVRTPGPAGRDGRDGVAGKDGVTKIPHLIVAATAEDLGPYLGSSDCAWVERAGGPICFAVSGPMSFSGADCTGTAYGGGHGTLSALPIGPRGNVYVFTGILDAAAVLRSHWGRSDSGGGSCTNLERPTPEGYPLDVLRNSGITVSTYKPSELAVDLR